MCTTKSSSDNKSELEQREWRNRALRKMHKKLNEKGGKKLIGWYRR
jgi:hypothetical protein